MNKIIQWFKKQDKTKKIVILFITISLFSIITIGIYNESRIMPIEETIQSEVKEVQTETKEIEDKEEIKPEPQKETMIVSKEEEKSNNKKIIKNNEESQKNNKQSQIVDEPKEEKKEVSQNTIEKTVTITLNVAGLDIENFTQTVTIKKGGTVYDALKKAASQVGKEIHGSSSYIKGIGELWEKDFGPMSGWMYSVNDIEPNKGCGSYVLEEGDHVKWYYVNAEQ